MSTWNFSLLDGFGKSDYLKKCQKEINKQAVHRLALDDSGNRISYVEKPFIRFPITNKECLTFNILEKGIAELDLSIRTTNLLEIGGITTVRDLIDHTDNDLLDIPKFGKTNLIEVNHKLKGLGLELACTDTKLYFLYGH